MVYTPNAVVVVHELVDNFAWKILFDLQKVLRRDDSDKCECEELQTSGCHAAKFGWEMEWRSRNHVDGSA